jgi:alanyl-tRNA synthetase
VIEKLKEINQLLEKKPPPGSTGSIITREEAINAKVPGLDIQGLMQQNQFESANKYKQDIAAGLPGLQAPIQTKEQIEAQKSVNALRDRNDELESETERMQEILTAARDMALDMGTQVIEALGEALAGGDMKDIGRNLLMSLANFLSQFGRMLIVMGLGLDAFVKSLATNNPILAIAAGTAMLITAGAIRGLISRTASSGGGGSGATASTGVTGTRYSGRAANMGSITVKVEGELRGRDIYWSGKRYAQEYENGT